MVITMFLWFRIDERRPATEVFKRVASMMSNLQGALRMLAYNRSPVTWTEVTEIVRAKQWTTSDGRSALIGVLQVTLSENSEET